MSVRHALLASAATLFALPALADEVNIYTTRQAFLIEPVMAAFTAETGIRSIWPSWKRGWWSG